MTAEQDSAQTLDLSINLAKTIYRGDDPITCRFVLRNAGAEPLLINQRFLLDVRISESEIYFVVRNQSGLEYPYNYLVLPRPLEAGDFAEIAPGDEIVRSYDLADLYGPRRPEGLTVQAFYRNRFPHPHKSKKPWTGELGSNVLEFFTQ